MDDYVRAVFLGLIQALTEFLPVSSSGHLVLASDVAGREVDSLTFDVGLHLGTTAAVLVAFWRQWTVIAAAGVIDLRRHHLAIQRWSWSARLGLWLVLGTVPAVLAGLAFENRIENELREPWVVGVALIVGGLLLGVLDHWGRRDYSLRHIGPATALGIGLAQTVALIPGISRSGATIGAGRGFGVRRVAAARFSFLLSTPVVLGAAVLKLGEAIGGGEDVQWGPLVLGAVVAGVAGLFVIRGLLAFLERHTLQAFVWYRIVLGTAVLIAVAVGAL